MRHRVIVGMQRPSLVQRLVISPACLLVRGYRNFWLILRGSGR